LKAWPRKNPFDKRWFQLMSAATRTRQRHDRLQAMLAKWEPRRWERGRNMPDYLLDEARRVAILVSDGEVDWSGFPEWVWKTNKGKHERD